MFFFGWTSLEIIQLLAEAGADLNAANDEGEWALYLAAWEGNVEAVVYLLSVGAKANVIDPHTGSALHMAVIADNMEIARLLIEAGVDVNAVDGDRWTCLWWLKSPEMALFLLSWGADPSMSAWGSLPEDLESHSSAVKDILRAHRVKNSEEPLE